MNGWDHGKEEQVYQILLRNDSSLQGHATLADFHDHWGRVELNGVTGRAQDTSKQNSLLAEPDNILSDRAPQGSQCHHHTLKCSTAVP